MAIRPNTASSIKQVITATNVSRNPQTGVVSVTKPQIPNKVDVPIINKDFLYSLSFNSSDVRLFTQSELEDITLMFLFGRDFRLIQDQWYDDDAKVASTVVSAYMDGKLNSSSLMQYPTDNSKKFDLVYNPYTTKNGLTVVQVLAGEVSDSLVQKDLNNATVLIIGAVKLFFGYAKASLSDFYTPFDPKSFDGTNGSFIDIDLDSTIEINSNKCNI